MDFSRRNILKVAAAGRAAAVPSIPLLSPEPALARAPLKLPTWKYGKGSFADDMVLMFRGNPEHTFYGTGPVPDKP